MRAFIFVSLVLAITASAAPQRGRGRGRGRFGGGNRGGNAGAANPANNAGSGAGAAGNANNDNDPQKSLTLDPKVIATGFQNDGLANANGAPFVASLTSTNNFINFCADKNVAITNGKQIKEGSCNPAPMGLIPSVENMPSSKFTFPGNGDVLQTGQIFTITMATKNLELGNFVNAQQNYFAAPQQLNGQGNIIGHSHITIDKVKSFQDTEPTDPTYFAYFKGINTPADADGVVSVTLDKGLPAGVYRLASINAAANHQPVLVPVEQHGFLDDMVYFTVADDPSSVRQGFGGQ
ncbi:hypothetical protein WG66_011701 [Moniliophthora roreri]|uniref:Uncharacterized protein n=1 Tax=Moniliophthora roreri TaxID=221103 RepID=A0A0W0F9M4_MONRR|nr:hypothetical protein WG66_011701 [Moniliophthora roreri]